MRPSNQPPIMGVDLRHTNLDTHVPQAHRPNCRYRDCGGRLSWARSYPSKHPHLSCPGPPELCAPEPWGHEAHVAAPSSADVKNEWNYTSTPKYAFISLR